MKIIAAIIVLGSVVCLGEMLVYLNGVGVWWSIGLGVAHEWKTNDADCDKTSRCPEISDLIYHNL